MSPPSQLPATIKNDNNIVAADGDESGGAIVTAGAAEGGEKAVAGVGADVEAINGDDENKVEEVGKVLASVAVTINHGGANDTTEESEDASKGEEERCSNFDDDGNNGATSSSHPPDTGVRKKIDKIVEITVWGGTGSDSDDSDDDSREKEDGDENEHEPNPRAEKLMDELFEQVYRNGQGPTAEIVEEYLAMKQISLTTGKADVPGFPYLFQQILLCTKWPVLLYGSTNYGSNSCS